LGCGLSHTSITRAPELRDAHQKIVRANLLAKWTYVPRAEIPTHLGDPVGAERKKMGSVRRSGDGPEQGVTFGRDGLGLD
jgi:hypothetical protein